jgi:DNA-binding CsgD family transcriptional regulator
MVASAVIGREDELAQIERFLERAVSGGRPAVLLLEGEPGIGKSTLWRVAVARAREKGVHVLTARPAEPEQPLSFAALGDLFADYSARLASLPPPQRRALRAALLLADTRGAPPEPRALGVAVSSLLRLLARSDPVLLALDNLQWIDSATAGALQFALRRVDDARVSVLAVARADETLPIELEEPERLPLRSMAFDSLASVIEATLGERLQRPTLARIIQTSAGNPLYALELGRAVLDRGGAYDSDQPPPPPSSLRQVVAERLERLSPPTREALLTAAAAAQPTTQLLEAALGRVPELGPAVEAAVLDRADGAVTFAHPVFASVLYAEAPAGLRRRAHARLADVVPSAEERARHMAAASTDPDEAVARALEDAATAAENRGASGAAADLAERAVALTPSDSPALGERRLRAAKRHYDAGNLSAARDLLEVALAEASDGTQRARVLHLLGGVLNDSDNTRRAIDTYREALRHAEDDARLRAILHACLAYVIQFVTGPRAAEADARIALELAERTGDEMLVAQCRATVARLDFWLGRGVQRAAMQAAIELERSGLHLRLDLPLDPQPTLVLASQLAVAGELDEARDHLRGLIVELREAGKPLNAVLHRLSLLEHRAGDWSAAESYAEEALKEARQAGEEAWQRFGLHALATVRAHRGEVEEAKTLIDTCWRVAEATGQPTFVVGCGELLGFLALSRGDAAEAERQLAPGHATLRAMGVDEPRRFSFLPDEIEALLKLGRLDEAETWIEWLDERGRALDRTWALATAARCRGLLAEARGEPLGVTEAFDAALRAHERLREPFDLGRTALAYGAFLRRRRQKSSARDRLEQAVAIFEDLGAALWAAKARRELAQVGGRAPRAGSLTETERDVAELVAAGKSNHEVAQALFISPKTVEWNLSKVYRKLHVASRTELAAKLARQSAAVRH